MSKDEGRNPGIEIGKEEGESLRGEIIIKMEEEGRSQEVGQVIGVIIGKNQEVQGIQDRDYEVIGRKVKEGEIQEGVLGERVQIEEVQEESIREKGIGVNLEREVRRIRRNVRRANVRSVREEKRK